MAAFDFPNSPSNNQTYTANGIKFIWNGSVWKKDATSGVKGEKGQKGEQGDKGQKGQKGIIGDVNKGQKGELGPEGGDGGIGDKGNTGSKGEKGQKGTQGDIVAGTFNVTLNGAQNRYLIDSVEQPTLRLVRGFRYNFNVNVSGHPFWIKTSQTTGTSNGASGVTNNGAQTGTVVFDVPLNAPSTLYYICQLHNYMYGIINTIENGQKGDKGQKGEDNSTKGQKGEDNSTKGQKGEDNSTKGQKGQKGNQGDSIKGQKGATGADNSTKGQKGAQGSGGTDGVDGTDGTDGTDGVDGQKGQKGEVGSITAAIPSGGIIMWSGAENKIGQSVASGGTGSGWYLCNGSNGTPDLRDRFVVGAGSGGSYSVDDTGGSKDAVVVEHNHSITDSGHFHTTQNYVARSGYAEPRNFGVGTDGNANNTGDTNTKTTGISIDNAGVSGTNKNLPPYYALCYIMKS